MGQISQKIHCKFTVKITKLLYSKEKVDLPKVGNTHQLILVHQILKKAMPITPFGWLATILHNLNATFH